MFCQNSCAFTVSGLKEGMTKLNPKCTGTLKWQNYSFKVSWKQLIGDKIQENPLHENFVILSSLGEHAFKTM